MGELRLVMGGLHLVMGGLHLVMCYMMGIFRQRGLSRVSWCSTALGRIISSSLVALCLIHVRFCTVVAILGESVWRVSLERRRMQGGEGGCGGVESLVEAARLTLLFEASACCGNQWWL
jgi:hypothetical protein